MACSALKIGSPLIVEKTAYHGRPRLLLFRLPIFLRPAVFDVFALRRTGQPAVPSLIPHRDVGNVLHFISRSPDLPNAAAMKYRCGFMGEGTSVPAQPRDDSACPRELSFIRRYIWRIGVIAIGRRSLSRLN